MVPRVVKHVFGPVVLAGVLLLTGAACADTIEPATLDDKQTPVEPIRSSEPPATPSEPTGESASPTVSVSYPPVDVCSFVTPEQVEEIFQRGKVPTVEEPDGEPIAVPGASPTYRCGFRWKPGETSEILTISVLRHTGTGDPQEFLDGVLVGYEEVGDVGDVAGIDLEQTFGNQTAALVSAKETEDGTAGVIILGPQQAGVSAFAELARVVFGQL